MVARGRRMRFTVTLMDKPGSLVQMLDIIAKARANILTVEHDKLGLGLNPNEITVHVACEVGGVEHGRAVLDALRGCGYRVQEK